jgi:Protein of unknown function (DUF2505)
MSFDYRFEAGADKVFALLTDADFLVDRCLALGERSAECSVEDDDDEVVINLTREVERNVPAFLSRLFGSSQTVEMVERWQARGATRQGRFTLKVVGQPVVVEATMTLRRAPKGGGCVYSIEHSAKANIPLVGRRVESFILGQTEAGARAELDYLAKALV